VIAKLVIPREAAQRDIDQAIAHYAAEAGEPVALAFIDALERTFRRIARHRRSARLGFRCEEGPHLRQFGWMAPGRIVQFGRVAPRQIKRRQPHQNPGSRR
jgi:plasmid stabilization system protein ParE